MQILTRRAVDLRYWKSLFRIGLAILTLGQVAYNGTALSAPVPGSPYGKLYWPNYEARKIESINRDGTGRTDVVTGISSEGSGPISIAVDAVAQKIYWLDDGEATIYTANLDGTDKAVFVADPGYASTLFFNPLDGRLYWPNYEARKIESIKGDGTGRQDVITDIAEVNAGPISIAIDAVAQKIYWLDDGEATIYTANLDGTDQAVFVTDPGYASTLFFNPLDGRLYWPNYEARKIESIKGDGTGRQDVITDISEVNAGPISIAIDAAQEKIYWLDDKEISIYTANLDGTGKAVMVNDPGYASNLTFPYEYPASTNTPPIVSGVTFDGNLEVGTTLNGTYSFTDDEGDNDASTFTWYRYDAAMGEAGKTAIGGATTPTYTVQAADVGKYLSFEVTPHDGTDGGVAVQSNRRGPVAAAQVVDLVWKLRSSAADHQWRSVTYGNGLFVAVAGSATDNAVMTSVDGLTWELQQTPEYGNIWYSVTYGNDLFVAVASSGSSKRVMTSPDGVNWTARATPSTGNYWVSVAYGNGRFVAVASAGDGNNVMTSEDGINWTQRTPSEINAWRSITYGGGQFVAVASNGTNRVMTSPDGINWTSTASNHASAWYSVTYGGGQYVAVASGGTNRVMTSPDGITWTLRSAAGVNTWYSVVYGAGQFIAVGSAGTGNQVMKSTNGINWTLDSTPSTNGWYAVTCSDQKFVAVAITGTGDRVMTADIFAANAPPTVANVIVTGTMLVGVTVEGNYDFDDEEENADHSTYQWYRYDAATGDVGKIAIGGATTPTYTLQADDAGKYLSFEVTPHDGTDAGTRVESERQGPVTDPANAPVFNSIPSETAAVDVAYRYAIGVSDPNGVPIVVTAPTLPDWLTLVNASTASTLVSTAVTKPGGVAQDADGNIYVTSAEYPSISNKVHRIAPDGTVDLNWATREIGQVSSMVELDGYIYLANYDSNKVTKIAIANPEAGETTVLTVGQPICLTTYNGDLYVGRNAAIVLKVNIADNSSATYVDVGSSVNIRGLTFDRDGNLYIAQWNKNNIVKYDGATVTPVLTVSAPYDIKYAADGSFYIASLTTDVGMSKYSSDFEFVKRFDEGQVRSLSISSSGRLVYGIYAANRIVKLEAVQSLYGTPQLNDAGDHEVSLRASNGTQHTDQNFTITVEGPAVVPISPTDGILYVNKNSSGNGSGDSWENAVPELADALKWAREQWGDDGVDAGWDQTNPLQVWVAEGTYKPLYDAADGEYTVDGGRDNAFVLVPFVQLYGGFLGSETVRSDRDWKNNKTILSGDLDNSNGLSNGDAYHVVVGVNYDGKTINEHTVLDGFTVTGGNANENIAPQTVNGVSITQQGGGGLSMTLGNPTVANVIFTGNHAFNGGAVYNSNASNPSFRDVSIVNNTASGTGAGMFNGPGASPLLVNVEISENTATAQGGGMGNVSNSNPKLVNVIISQNVGGNYGGAMYNYSSSPVLTNVTISGNSATVNGGGLYNDGTGTAVLANTLTWENAVNGDATGASASIYNTGTGAQPSISYSLIANSGGSGSAWNPAMGVDGGHNLDADPLFSGEAANGYALTALSPALNVGDNNAYTAAGGDLDNDRDLAGAARLKLATIDIGAYEYQLPPTPILEVPEPGTYKIGDELVFVMDFHAPVTVNGEPRLLLTVGETQKTVVFVGLSEDKQFATFKYTVKEDDLDNDGLDLSGTVDLEGGSITFDDTELGSVSMAYTLASALTDVQVDGVRPVLTEVSIASDNETATAAKIGDKVTVTIEASEAIEAPEIEIAGNKATVSAVGEEGLTWIAEYVLTDADESGIVVFTISGLLDAAGNTVPDVTTVTDESTVTFYKMAPVVEGVVQGEYYNEDVTAIFEGAATLNGEPYVSGTPVTEEGGYKLTVTDAAGNSTTVAFTIDKTAPIVTGVEDGGYYNDVTVTFDEGTAMLNGQPYVAGTPITEEGEYELVVTDASGNETMVSFTVDKTVPVVNGVEDGGYYSEDVTVTFDEGTAMLNGQPYVAGTPITEEGEYELVVTDASGNETTVSFTVDKTAPEVTGVEDGGYYNKDVTVTFDEGTAMLNGQPYVAGTPITEEGEYELVVTDAAGNMTVVAFTVDKTVPVVTGVEDGGYYNEDVTVTFDEGTAMLNGQPYVAGTPITEEGKYELVITDASGNVTVVAFTIDKSTPVVEGVEDGAYYNEVVTVTFDEGTATLNGQPYVAGTPITEEGDYELVVADAAGNVTVVAFTVDKTVPVVTGVEDGGYYSEDVTVTFDEGTATLNGQPYVAGTPITEEGEYELVVTDASGNETTVSFTVDKTAPEVTGVEDGGYYNEDVTVTFDEGTAMLNGRPYVVGTPITEEGEYELVVTDASGNETTVSFTVDKTTPVVSGVEDGGYYSEDVTVTFDEGTATLNGQPYVAGTPITEEGEYELVVTDASGNETTVSFTVDKTAPEVTGVEDGGYYSEDVTVTFDEGTAMLNGRPYVAGTPITEEGEYELVITDASGNETTVSFTVDKTVPVVNGVEDGGYYNEDVTVTLDEGTATLKGQPYVAGTPITEEGEYTLVVTDAAGNSTMVIFTIDKTAPQISGVVNGSNYENLAVPTFSEGSALLNGKPYLSGTPITEKGAYELIVTDQAGNTATIFFAVADLPDAPTGLQATPGNKQATLDWQAPAGELLPVTDYLIQYSGDGGQTWTTAEHPPLTGTRVVVIGLDNNRSYQFRIASVNEFGAGAFSKPLGGVIPTEPVPDGDGNLPEPAPGEIVVITDSKVEAVTLEVVDEEYLRLRGDGYAMMLASLGIDGERIPISAIDAVIRLVRGMGAGVYVSGEGFEPGTVITVYLFSVPELVGHIPVKSDGTFAGTLPIPTHLEAGRHTLQANGIVAGGGERSVSIGLLLVDNKPQRIDFDALTDKTYGDGPVKLSASATSGLPISYAVTDAAGSATDIVTVTNGNELHIHSAGEVRVTAIQAGDLEYAAAAPVSRTLRVGKAPLSVTVSDATRSYGEANPPFEVTYQGFVNGEDASALVTRPAAATEATETTVPGSYAITLSGGESANYAFAYRGANLMITKAKQTITLNAPTEIARDAGSITLDVSATSGLPITLEVDDAQVATVNGNTLNIHRLGSVSIKATQTGDGNHEAAEPVTVTILVVDPTSDFPVRVHKAVSPNGDGINEFLMIEGIRDHKDNRVTIISRNGTLLWEASGYDNDRVAFRGISTAQLQLPAGTYFYVVEVKVNGRWEHQKGYFVLRY